MEDRAWTCAKCGLGIPWAPSSQIARSRDACLAKCAQGISAAENHRILRAWPKNKFLAYQQKHRNCRGWHDETWRRERVAEAAAQGHDLKFFGKQDLIKSSRLKFTCTKCKTLSSCASNFGKTPRNPKNKGRSLAWKALRLQQDEDLGALYSTAGFGLRPKLWLWMKRSSTVSVLRHL